MRIRTRARWSWLAAFLCVHTATAFAQTTGPTASGGSLAVQAAPVRPLVWLLPDDPRERLTYALEVDASGRMVPGIPPPDRLSTKYHGQFLAVCVAPCALRVPAGNYSLGLARNQGQPVPVANPLIVDHDTTVVGHYQSNRWRRGLGISALVVSTLVGALLLAAAVVPSQNGSATCADYCGEPAPSSTNLLIGGITTFAVGITSGILLLATGRDTATMVQR